MSICFVETYILKKKNEKEIVLFEFYTTTLCNMFCKTGFPVEEVKFISVECLLLERVCFIKCPLLMNSDP